MLASDFIPVLFVASHSWSAALRPSQSSAGELLSGLACGLRLSEQVYSQLGSREEKGNCALFFVCFFSLF